MNIDEMTYGDLKQIASVFNTQKQIKDSFLQKYIGEYVIVRTRNEGINFGKLKDIDETGVVLSNARRLYYHKPKNTGSSWYEGVSIYGLSDDSKISDAVSEKVIVEDYSITICSEDAIQSLKTHKSHVQD